MNTEKTFVISVALLATAIVSLTQTGCVTTKTTTVTAGTNSAGLATLTTNVVVTVNQANLALDCAGIQAATGLTVAEVLQKDPTARPVIVDVQTGLNGILNGATPATTAQAEALITKSNNAAVTAQLTPIINNMSSLEQSLIKKYGAGVGGQIAVAVTTAVLNGINAGLQ